MSWCVEHEILGLKVQLFSGCGLAGMGQETVGFCCDDTATRLAVETQDPRISHILQTLFRDKELWSVAFWCRDAYWWREESHDPNPKEAQIKFAQALCTLKDNQYAREEDRARAASELQRIERERAEKEARKRLVKKRRSEFRAQRADIAIALIERDGYYCQRCGKVDERLEVDHVIPLSKGGADELDNLQWLCRSCNSAKGDRNE